MTVNNSQLFYLISKENKPHNILEIKNPKSLKPPLNKLLSQAFLQNEALIQKDDRACLAPHKITISPHKVGFLIQRGLEVKRVIHIEKSNKLIANSKGFSTIFCTLGALFSYMLACPNDPEKKHTPKTLAKRAFDRL